MSIYGNLRGKNASNCGELFGIKKEFCDKKNKLFLVA